MADPRIRYDILANAEGEQDVARLASEVEKLDDAFDPKVQERARALAEELRQLGQAQTAIGRFRELKGETQEAAKALEAAQAAAQKMGRELAETEKPTRAQVGQFEKLKDAVQAAKENLESKTRALDGSRAELGKLGVATDTLARSEVQLRTALQATKQEVQQLGQQGQAVQRFQELAQATQDAKRRFEEADAAVEAYRRGLSSTETPTRTQVTELARLSETARQAQVAFQGASQTQAESAAQLRAAGVDVGKLTAAQGKLAPAQREVTKETEAATAAQQRNAQSLGQLTDSSKTAVQQLGDMKVELAAAGAAVLGIQKVLGGAASAAAEFGTAMAEVSTLLDDTSQLDALGESVRSLAREFGTSAPEQARALYQIISAGATDAAQATELLEAANRLAVGGVTDVKTAADGLTSVLNAYGPAAGSARDVSDALFVAMRAGKTTVGELSAGIGQVAPLAAQAGVGIDELLAAVAALTKGGLSTSQALTQMRGVVAAVVKPTADATKIAEELGLKFDLQGLKAKGLAGFLEDLRVRTAGNADVQAKLFGSVEALGAALALTGNQASSFGEILESMGRKAGESEAATAKMLDTPAVAARKLQAALADVQLSLGQAVTAFTPLLEATTGALSVFNELPGPIKSTTAGVTAAALAVPALTAALGSISRALGLARLAFVAKGAAAAATVAPMTAAAAGTAAVGTAAATATPAIGAAAVATTALARAATLLKAALPIGLILTVAQLASEFFRVKKAAEEGEKAVDAMLAERPTPVVGAAQRTGVALDEAAQASQRAAAALTEQEAAARRAATALGVDLAKASSTVTAEFATQLDQLALLVRGLGELEKKGVDTATVVRDALAKLVDGAKNRTELDALTARVQALGKAGTVSKDQVVELMDTIKRKAAEAAGAVEGIEGALKTFGLKSQAELKATAENFSKAWMQIRDDATVSIEQKRAAFVQYANAAIAANGGVIDSQTRSQAQALKLAVEVDATGKTIVKAMDDATKGTDKLSGGFKRVGGEARKAAEEVDGVQRSVVSLSRAWETELAKRNAATRSTLTWEGRNADGSLDPNFVGNSGGSFFTPPPDSSGDWVWQATASRPGGEWVLSAEASARRFAEGEQARGLVPVRDPSGSTRFVSPSGAGGAAGASPFNAAARTVVVELKLAGSSARVPTTEEAAEELLALLERSRAAGGY